MGNSESGLLDRSRVGRYSVAELRTQLAGAGNIHLRPYGRSHQWVTPAAGLRIHGSRIIQGVASSGDWSNPPGTFRWIGRDRPRSDCSGGTHSRQSRTAVGQDPAVTRCDQAGSSDVLPMTPVCLPPPSCRHRPNHSPDRSCTLPPSRQVVARRQLFPLRHRLRTLPSFAFA